MTLLEQLDAIALGDIPAALLHLTARLVTGLEVRDLTPAKAKADSVVGSIGDERPMLTAKEVAKRLQTRVRFVYDHQKELGGKQISPRCVRFPPASVDRYLELRKAQA